MAGRRLAAVVILGAALGFADVPPTEAVPRVEPTPAGTVEILGRSTEACPTGSRCFTFEATCGAPAPAPPLTGQVAIGVYTAPLRGVLVAFGGGGGQDFWLAGAGGRAVRKPLARNGIEIISVAWDRSWNEGTVGMAALACRSAAVVAWASTRLPTGPDQAGVCGVCVIGYSVGTAQVAGALSFSDVADRVDGAILVSGPPTADIEAGCRREGTPLQYLEASTNQFRNRVDDSYDNADPSAGPCAMRPEDLSAVPQWDAASLTVDGRVAFPSTRFHFIWGDRDRTGAAGQGITYLGALSGAGSPLLAYACVDAGHDVFAVAAGQDALLDAILWVPADGLNVPPVPPAGIESRCGGPTGS